MLRAEQLALETLGPLSGHRMAKSGKPGKVDRDRWERNVLFSKEHRAGQDSLWVLITRRSQVQILAPQPKTRSPCR